jgi:predicted phosphoribosyltransferase/dienelactone hydrolase
MIGRRDALEEITVRAGATELHATLGVPPGPIGLAILVDGSGASARDRHVAEALRARGLATLLLDLWTAAERRADGLGDSLRFEVDKLAERLTCALAWVQRESPVAHLPIAYCGAGTAAAVALIVAAQRPEVARAVVSRGGRPDLAGAWLPHVTAPTLLVVGGNDAEELELNREAIERMTVPTQLAIVPDQPGSLDDVAQIAAEWIVENLAREPSVDHGDERAFEDRRTAGQRLSVLLQHHAGPSTIVYGLAGGGMPVADEISCALDAPLDVWLARKLGMPIQPEIGMGAIAEGAAIVLDPGNLRWSGASARELLAIVHRKAREIRRRARQLRGDHPPLEVRGKTAILVDDVIATAGTLRAAIRGAHRRGATRVVVAAPVAAEEAVVALRLEADEVVALAVPQRLIALAAWYREHHSVGDSEVVEILAEARRRYEERALVA